MRRRQLPAWDPVTPLAAPPASQASKRAGTGEESITFSQQQECGVSFLPLATKILYWIIWLFFFFLSCRIITWEAEQVSVVVFKKPQWHQTLPWIFSHKSTDCEPGTTMTLPGSQIQKTSTGAEQAVLDSFKTTKPRGGDEFKVNWSAPLGNRKWSFHRRGAACFRAAALERSPDGCLSRLNNKRGVCLANSRSSTYIIPRDDVHRKRCQLLFPCIGLNVKGNIWLTVFLAEIVKGTYSFLFLSVESSEAKLGAVVMGYILPCNRV